MSVPLVSVVMPAFNASEFIIEAIESVVSQKFKDWELIVVDDASIDDTKEIVEKYSQKYSRIKLISLSVNSGPASSRNFAIDVANGRFIAFLDSDDFWDADFLEKMISFSSSKKTPLVYASYRRLDETSGRYRKDFIVPSEVCYEDLLLTNPISCLTAFYDTSFWGKEYMIDCAREDYTLWLKILKKSKLAYGYKPALATYRIRSESQSRSKLKMAIEQWKVYRDIERIGYIKRVWVFINYSFNGVVKNFL